MSKEKKFHQLIEELEQEKKAAAWNKIKEKELAEQPLVHTVSFDLPKRRKLAVWKKALATSLVSVVLVGGGIFVGIRHFSNDHPTARYCDASMYTLEYGQMTLKERSLQENKDFLYLDWYDRADYMDMVYQLKDTGEEIGYQEKIIAIDTGLVVNVHITEKEYQLETLERYEQATETEEINAVKVKWENIRECSYANFSYGDYNYCVVLEYPMEEDSILDIVEEMLTR